MNNFYSKVDSKGVIYNIGIIKKQDNLSHFDSLFQTT